MARKKTKVTTEETKQLNEVLEFFGVDPAEPGETFSVVVFRTDVTLIRHSPEVVVPAQVR